MGGGFSQSKITSETKTAYLVTGYKDLLVLKKYKDTKIITPRDFELLFGDRGRSLKNYVASRV